MTAPTKADLQAAVTRQAAEIAALRDLIAAAQETAAAGDGHAPMGDDFYKAGARAAQRIRIWLGDIGTFDVQKIESHAALFRRHIADITKGIPWCAATAPDESGRMRRCQRGNHGENGHRDIGDGAAIGAMVWDGDLTPEAAVIENPTDEQDAIDLEQAKAAIAAGQPVIIEEDVAPNRPYGSGKPCASFSPASTACIVTGLHPLHEDGGGGRWTTGGDYRIEPKSDDPREAADPGYLEPVPSGVSVDATGGAWS